MLNKKQRHAINETRNDIQLAVKMVKAEKKRRDNRENFLLTTISYLAQWLSDETGIDPIELMQRAKDYAADYLREELTSKND